MKDISGYSFDIIEKSVFSRLSSCTADAIGRKLEAVDEIISAEKEDVFISLGENCGPAIKIRDTGIKNLGSSFFDNTVIRVGDIPKIISDQFRSILSIMNLSIGRWEGHDSVFDEFYNIFFHHYFHPGDGFEKIENGSRKIESKDIPLFLPVVRGQFEYLAAKFIKIARSGIRKYYLVRNVEGQPVPDSALDDISSALISIGSVNFSIVQVISSWDAPVSSEKYGRWIIPEEGERWGAGAEWLAYAQGRERGISWE